MSGVVSLSLQLEVTTVVEMSCIETPFSEIKRTPGLSKEAAGGRPPLPLCVGAVLLILLSPQPLAGADTSRKDLLPK